MRDRSKMLTIAPKMNAFYDKKKNELRLTNLNYNILGYIAAGISLIEYSPKVLTTPRRAQKK